VIHSGSMAALGALVFVLIASMGMEIVEQAQQRTGRREEGLLGTVNSFVHKLVGAGGVLISGIIISFVGFDTPGIDRSALYGGEAIIQFGWIHVAIGFCLPIISTLLVLLYDIDRNVHHDNLTDLGYSEK
jgi:GPH family glycoside/pentoside/hexuronide:cation symporter